MEKEEEPGEERRESWLAGGLMADQVLRRCVSCFARRLAPVKGQKKERKGKKKKEREKRERHGNYKDKKLMNK